MKLHGSSLRLLIFGSILLALLLQTRHLAYAIPTAFNVWEPVPAAAGSDSVEARHEAAYLNVNGTFYLLGGRGTRAVQKFDPSTEIWSNTGQQTNNIHHFQPVVYNGLIYIVGAFTGGYPNETPVADVLTYDPNNDSWGTDGQLPAARRRGSAGAVVYNNKIYLIGGNTNGHNANYVPWFDEFDPATNTWTTLADAPTARDHFTAVVIGDQLVVVGGRQTDASDPDGVFDNVVPEVDLYDFTTGTWSTLPAAANLNPPRAGVMNVPYGDEVIVIGGESLAQSSAHNDVQALDITTNTWRTLDNLLQGRHSGGAVMEANRIYVAAGNGTRGGGNELNSQEAFTFDVTPSAITTYTISSQQTPIPLIWLLASGLSILTLLVLVARFYSPFSVTVSKITL